MVTSLLQGCKYFLYVPPFMRNRVCWRGIFRGILEAFLVPLKTTWHFSWLGSPAHQQGLPGTTGLSQPGHYRPSFPVPHAENSPKADWGMGFQELLPWWGSQLTKKNPKQQTTGSVEGQTDEYQNQGGVGLHHQHKGRRKQIILSSASAEVCLNRMNKNKFMKIIKWKSNLLPPRKFPTKVLLNLHQPEEWETQDS